MSSRGPSEPRSWTAWRGPPWRGGLAMGRRQATVVARGRGLAAAWPRGLARDATPLRPEVRRRPGGLPRRDRRAVRADRWLHVPGWWAPRTLLPDRDRRRGLRGDPGRARGAAIRLAGRRRDGGGRPRRRRRLRDPRRGAGPERGAAARAIVQRDDGAPRLERGQAPPAPRGRRARAPDPAVRDPGEPRGARRRRLSDRRSAPALRPRGDQGDVAAAERPADALDRRGRRAHPASRTDRTTRAGRRRRPVVRHPGERIRGSGSRRGSPTRSRRSRWTVCGSARS